MSRGVKIVALSAVALLAVIAVALTLAPRRQPPLYRSSYVVPSPSQHPVALFVGDDFASGAAGVSPSATFAPLACASLGWVCHVDGQPGTGYQSEGLDQNLSNRRYSGRLADDRSGYLADVVVVTGGRRDVGRSGEDEAALAYYKAVRAAYPGALVVVVEPFWIGTDPPPAVRSLRAQVHRAAIQAKSVWVASDDWLPQSLASKDQVHLTPEGHAELSAHLVAALRRMTITTRSG